MAAIKDFKEIYKTEFGIEISDQEAQNQGIRLLQLMNLVYKPISKEWINKHEK